MRTHESQNKSSQFTAKFQEIEDHIDELMNRIQNVVSEGRIISKNWSQCNSTSGKTSILFLDHVQLGFHQLSLVH